MTDREWQVGDKAVAWVRGVADVEVVRTDDPEFPWHSDERVPDYFGPQTEHPERHVKRLRPLEQGPLSEADLCECDRPDGRDNPHRHERSDLCGGLGDRYRVERVNDPTGKHSDCRYFVLDPEHDPIARLALAVYASRVGENGNERLEMDLVAWLDDIKSHE